MNENRPKLVGGVTGKGFIKGDKRIRRSGHPHSFHELRELGLRIAAEKVIAADGELITRAEHLLRSWAKSRVPALQLAFAAYCWGKPPEKLEINELAPRTVLRLHFAHEMDAIEAGNGTASFTVGPLPEENRLTEPDSKGVCDAEVLCDAPAKESHTLAQR